MCVDVGKRTYCMYIRTYVVYGHCLGAGVYDHYLGAAVYGHCLGGVVFVCYLGAGVYGHYLSAVMNCCCPSITVNCISFSLY